MNPSRPNIFEFSKPLQEELEYRMELEEQSDEFEGYPDRILWIHREFMDLESLFTWSLGDKQLRQFQREMRKWWIANGIYREITQAELDRTTVWSGGRSSKGKAEFKMGGKMYVFDKHPPGYFGDYQSTS